MSCSHSHRTFLSTSRALETESHKYTQATKTSYGDHPTSYPNLNVKQSTCHIVTLDFRGKSLLKKNTAYNVFKSIMKWICIVGGSWFQPVFI
jgi:hypothetical protein